MYVITPYTKEKAKQAGLTVQPSTRKGKKLDVFKDGKYLTSVGALGYGDFPSYLKEKGLAYAEERRRLYHLRHKEETLAGQLAKYLLW